MTKQQEAEELHYQEIAQSYEDEIDKKFEQHQNSLEQEVKTNIDKPYSGMDLSYIHQRK